MNKSIRNGLLFIGTGVFFLLIGIWLDESTIRDENIKNFFLFAGLSIIGLYVGLSWKRPSYPGGVVHKYAAIGIGILFAIYSIYLLTQIF